MVSLMVRKTILKTSSKEAGEQRPISINLTTISLVVFRISSFSEAVRVAGLCSRLMFFTSSGRAIF